MPARPSDRPRALIARRSERVEGLSARIRDAGWAVDALSPIAFEPPRDIRAAVRAVGESDRYERIAFTSPEGVRRFFAVRAGFETAAESRLPPDSIRAAAIGRGTSETLALVGVRDVWCGDRADGAGLAEAFPASPSGRRVLVVGPEEGRPDLAEGLCAKGWRVDGVPFYRTVPSEDVPAIVAGLRDGRWSAVLWASPSGVRAVAEVDREAMERAAEGGARYVAIGPTTAAALAAQGLDVVVAERPEDDVLVRALVLPSDASVEDSE